MKLEIHKKIIRQIEISNIKDTNFIYDKVFRQLLTQNQYDFKMKINVFLVVIYCTLDIKIFTSNFSYQNGRIPKHPIQALLGRKACHQRKMG